MPVFEISGFRMNYEVVPNVMAHDTLLIHGNMGSNNWWRPFIGELQKSGKKRTGSAIMAEWRGCGKSSPPENDQQLMMPNLANDYLQLLKHLVKPRVDVVGHSTGGLLALLAMAQEPHVFRRCVLLDPVLPSGLKFADATLDVFQQMRRDRAVCELVMATAVHNVKVSDPLFQQLVDDAFQMAPPLWMGIPKALSYDYTEDVRSLDHPILFLQGDQDPIVLPADARLFSSSRKNVTYREVANHGHSLNIEAPADFTGRVLEFLGS
jgi:pimeloyl-ACP methyl ester carboxylesterase